MNSLAGQTLIKHLCQLKEHKKRVAYSLSMHINGAVCILKAELLALNNTFSPASGEKYSAATSWRSKKLKST